MNLLLSATKSLLPYFLILTTFGSAPVFAVNSDIATAPPTPKTENKKAWLHISEKDEKLKSILLEKFSFLEHRGPSQSEIDEMIRFLHTKENLDIVQVYKNEDGSATVELKSITKISSLTFKGLSYISETEARKVVGLEIGEAFDQDLLIEAGEKLRLYYKDQSFLNAVIDIELPRNNEKNVDVVFKIKENKRTEISELVFESPNPELNKRLKRSLSSHRGRPLSDSQLAEIQKEMRELFSKFGFYRARPIGPTLSYNEDESLVKLSFQIENIETYVFEFNGNKKESSSKLQEVLDLPNYYTSSPSLAQEIAGKIRNYYLQQGYARVEITQTESEGKNPFTRRVDLTIDEGPRVRITKFFFIGRLSRDEAYYEELLKESSPTNIKNGLYSRDDLEVAFKNFNIQLQNEGFLTSKIVSTRINYEKEDRSQVEIIVNLDEGPQTLIDEVAFEGAANANSNQLLEVLKMGRKGDPLRLNALEQAIVNLKSFYYEKGFIEMILINEKDDLVRYSENNTKAKIVFRIFEGPRVTVANIQLDGNRMTQDKVLLTEIEFKQGDIVTPSKIEESVARLQRTGHFSSVEIKTLEERTNIEQRTLIVRVKERDPGVFTMGVGATNENELTLHGYTGVSYRNISGWGRALSARFEGNYNIADIKYLESKVTLGYLEPYLFESRMRFRLNVSRSNTISDFNTRKVTELNYAVGSIEQDLTSHITLIYDILGVATYVDKPLDSNNNPGKVERKDQVISSTGPTIEVDYRDNPFNPTKGHFTRLGVEYSSENLGSSKVDEFLRTTFSFTHYKKLTSKGTIWANSFRGGLLQNTRHRDFGVPYDKKGFTLGGRSTIRGYESGEAFPTDKNSPINTNYALLGEASYQLIKSEVRIPMWGDVGLALFYDGGAVKITDVDLPSWRQSAGFGIRYNTPIGPVNLDFGFKLDRKPGESTGAFHLSIGSF